MPGYSTTFARASTQYLTNTSPSGLVTGNGSRSVFGWVKFTTVPSNQNYFLCDYTNGGTRGFAPFVTQSGGGSVKFALSDYVASNPTNITVSADVWYFWAVTHDGTNTRLYWDGSLINTTARTLVMASAPTVMRVATAANNTSDLTNGKLFGVGWTSDAKTQGELDAIQLLAGSELNSINITNLISVLCVTNDFNDVTGTNNMTAVNSPSQTTDIPVTDPPVSSFRNFLGFAGI